MLFVLFTNEINFIAAPAGYTLLNDRYYKNSAGAGVLPVTYSFRL